MMLYRSEKQSQQLLATGKVYVPNIIGKTPEPSCKLVEKILSLINSEDSRFIITQNVNEGVNLYCSGKTTAAVTTVIDSELGLSAEIDSKWSDTSMMLYKSNEMSGDYNWMIDSDKYLFVDKVLSVVEDRNKKRKEECARIKELARIAQQERISKAYGI